MNKLRLLSTLTGLLSLSAATATERGKLGVWIDDRAPVIFDRARALLTPPFDMAEVKELADVIVVGVQELKGVFAGADRAAVAQAVLIEAARAVLPDGVIEDVGVNLLDTDAVKKIIEDAFKRMFGPKAKPDATAAADAILNPATTTHPGLTGIIRESGAPEGAETAGKAPASDAGGEGSAQGAAGTPSAGTDAAAGEP